jgi:hypothetical protein
MDFKFFYLTWSLIFLVIWIILYALRKDLRREMLFISGFFGIGGILSELTNIQDWWRPLTITGTPIGIEDFIIGFAIGGIASVIYAECYYKRYRPGSRQTPRRNMFGHLYLLSFAVCFLTLFYVVKLSSFYSTFIAYLIGIIFIILKRKDLLRDSIISGILMLILALIIYAILSAIYPGYIQTFWYLNGNWYTQLIFGIPISEYFWFFLTGSFIGPLYEFVKNKHYM